MILFMMISVISLKGVYCYRNSPPAPPKTKQKIINSQIRKSGESTSICKPAFHCIEYYMLKVYVPGYQTESKGYSLPDLTSFYDVTNNPNRQRVINLSTCYLKLRHYRRSNCFKNPFFSHQC